MEVIGLLGIAFTVFHALGLAEMPGISQGFTGRDLGESDVTSIA